MTQFLSPDHPAAIRCEAALNKVAKWRSVFASWLLGTRPANDHEVAYHRDLRELVILLRVETSALSGLLLERGIVTPEQLALAFTAEADNLDKLFEAKFPGMTTSAAGVHMTMPAAMQTMRRLGFPA